MKKTKPFIQRLLIAGLLLGMVTACDKTDDSGDFSSAGTVKDADGYVYNTVKIGTQIWTVENLKTTKYNDGSPIPNVTDNDTWVNLKTGAYCNYNNLESNAEIYGRLYNWDAASLGKLAPAGWHVATYDDWGILENYLITNGYNYDNTKEGNKIAKSLCAKTNWPFSCQAGTPGAAPENNNITGFSALPGGHRCHHDGSFLDIGIEGRWWGVEDFNLFNGLGFFLNYNLEDLWSFSSTVSGLSVRLVKDESN